MAVKKKKEAKKKKVAKKKSTGKRVQFGGKTVGFGGRTDTVEKVFGKKPLAPSAMTKALWAYVKKNKLMK